LAYRCFVEVDDLTDFSSVEDTLKGLFASFDPGDEACNFVFAGLVGLDLLTFEIVAAGEADSI